MLSYMKATIYKVDEKKKNEQNAETVHADEAEDTNKGKKNYITQK